MSKNSFVDHLFHDPHWDINSQIDAVAQWRPAVRSYNIIINT